MHKKGQVAIEYLTTYGWIILIALLSVGVVSYLGMVNPNNYAPEECRIQGELDCLDKYLSTDGNLTFLIKNNYPVDLVLWNAQTPEGKLVVCTQTLYRNGSRSNLLLRSAWWLSVADV